MNKATRLAFTNAAISGALVFVGAFADGNITWVGTLAACSAMCVVFLTQLKDFYAQSAKKKALVPGVFGFVY